MDWGKPDDPLRNPKDPIHKSGPEAEKELFRRMSKVADGFSREAAISAAFNLAMGAIRQGNSTWWSAESAYDETVGRAKQVLRNHYDQNGKRRNIFPFHQHIEMPHFDARDKH
jgi:hypothetical protein